MIQLDHFRAEMARFPAITADEAQALTAKLREEIKAAEIKAAEEWSAGRHRRRLRRDDPRLEAALAKLDLLEEQLAATIGPREAKATVVRVERDIRRAIAPPDVPHPDGPRIQRRAHFQKSNQKARRSAEAWDERKLAEERRDANRARIAKLKFLGEPLPGQQGRASERFRAFTGCVNPGLRI